jgi:hypothetical protein
MAETFETALFRARQALDARYTTGGRDSGYAQAEATRAVGEAILALAAALRPEPVEVNVKVDAAEATAAAEEAVRRERRHQERAWPR